ncbi:hypothetical protein LX36DRAFT_301693 [Colletotrichum falcatum]|nr:hypothetical protein LX36DRAFT_301693 [Colletotrichum falcatum]
MYRANLSHAGGGLVEKGKGSQQGPWLVRHSRYCGPRRLASCALLRPIQFYLMNGQLLVVGYFLIQLLLQSHVFLKRNANGQPCATDPPPPLLLIGLDSAERKHDRRWCRPHLLSISPVDGRLTDQRFLSPFVDRNRLPSSDVPAKSPRQS